MGITQLGEADGLLVHLHQGPDGSDRDGRGASDPPPASEAWVGWPGGSGGLGKPIKWVVLRQLALTQADGLSVRGKCLISTPAPFK